MARDEDSDAMIAISPRDLTKVALQLEREAEEAANRRLRQRAQSEPSSNPTEEEQRLRNLEDALLVLAGRGGTNGKIGTLRSDVDGMRSVLKYIATAVAGSVITAALAVYQAGQRDGAKGQEAEYLRAEVASLKAEVRDLRAQLSAYRPLRRPQGDDQ